MFSKTPPYQIVKNQQLVTNHMSESSVNKFEGTKAFQKSARRIVNQTAGVFYYLLVKQSSNCFRMTFLFKTIHLIIYMFHNCKFLSSEVNF